MIPFWVKPLGATLLALSLWQAGQELARPFWHRRQELKRWQDVLAQLESEIGWDGRSLLSSLERVQRRAGGGVAQVLQQFCRRAEESMPTAELWADVVRQAGFLTAEDRDVLSALGPVLGRYSREEQRQHLSRLRERLRRQEEEAEAVFRREGRALATLVTLAGAALAVVLL